MATASLSVAHGELGVGSLSMHTNAGVNGSKPAIPKKPMASAIVRAQSSATQNQHGDMTLTQQAPVSRAGGQTTLHVTRLPATKPLPTHPGESSRVINGAVSGLGNTNQSLGIAVPNARSSSRSVSSNTQTANPNTMTSSQGGSQAGNANTNAATGPGASAGSSRQLSSASVSNQEEKDLNVGRYRIMRTIGKGNFARVKLARHVLTGCEVAIKIMDKSQMNQSTLQKVYREIRIMKTLDHPNITKLYEVIETPRNLYLVLEYAPNGELFDYLVTHGRMKEKDAREKFRQIISAVQYLHARSIVHRDLKDENLLLDENFNVKLCDFGFANEFHPERKLDTFCGSPPYAAPELYQGRKYDGPEVDTWSLGVILYTLVSGSLPFDGQNLRELREKVIHGKYRIPFYMSTDCENILKKMLQLVPQRRPTLESLMATDRWLNYENDWLQPHTATADDFADEERIEQLVRYGFTRAEIAESLGKRKYDHICAVYIMLRTRRERELHSTGSTKHASGTTPKMAPSSRDRTTSNQPQAESHAPPPQTGFVPARGAVSAIASIRAPVRNRAPLTSTSADAPPAPVPRRNLYENVATKGQERQPLPHSNVADDEEYYYRDDEIDRLAAELDAGGMERAQPLQPTHRADLIGVRRQPTYHPGDRRTQQMLLESQQMAALDRAGKQQNVQNLHELATRRPPESGPPPPQPHTQPQMQLAAERKRSVGATLPQSATQPCFNVAPTDAEPPHTYANVPLSHTVSTSVSNWQHTDAPLSNSVTVAQSASLARSAKTRDSPHPLAAPTHTITEFGDDDGSLDQSGGRFVRQANVRRTCPTNATGNATGAPPQSPAETGRSRSVRSKPQLTLAPFAASPEPHKAAVPDVQPQAALVRSGSLRRSSRRAMELPPPPPPPPAASSPVSTLPPPLPPNSRMDENSVLIVKSPMRVSQRGATPDSLTTPTTPTQPQMQRFDQSYEPVNVAGGTVSNLGANANMSANARASFRQSQPLAPAPVQPPSWQQSAASQPSPPIIDPSYAQAYGPLGHSYNGYPQAYPYPYTNPYSPNQYPTYASQNHGQHPQDPSYADVNQAPQLQRSATRNSYAPPNDYVPQFNAYTPPTAQPQTPIYSRPQRPSTASNIGMGTLQSGMSTTGRRVPPPPPPPPGSGSATVGRSHTHGGSVRNADTDSHSHAHVRPSRTRSKSNVFGRLARFFRRSSRRRGTRADEHSPESGSGSPSPSGGTLRDVDQSEPSSPTRRPRRSAARRNESAATATESDAEGKSEAGFARSDPTLIEHGTLSRKPRSLRFTFRFRFASPLPPERLLERVEAALENANCLFRRTEKSSSSSSATVDASAGKNNPFSLQCEFVDVQNADLNCKWTMEIVHLPRLGLNGVRCKRLEGHEVRYRGLVNRLLGDLSVSVP